MASGSLIPRLYRPGSSVCGSCAKRLPRQQARWVGVKYLEKQRLADETWQERAQKIDNGELQNTWDLLNERGFIKDVAGSVHLALILLPFPHGLLTHVSPGGQHK
jgi:tyrosyl-tRNA synthetase